MINRLIIQPSNKTVSVYFMRFQIIVIFIVSGFYVSGQEVQVLKEPAKLDSVINSSSEEIFPIISGDKTLYFVRTFHDENIGGRLGGQDIWYSRRDSTGSWQEPVNFDALNTAGNNAVVGVADNDSTLYLFNTYSNPLRWKYGISSAKIKNNRWSKPKELPILFNSSGTFHGYYVSGNEQVILVSSEGEGALGKEDLYLYYLEAGKWEGPVHLGEKVNSAGSEISPFITVDLKVLFFASDGHQGFGGFDIFMSERLDDGWENWSAATNIGSDINSPHFEGYFSTYEDGETFYVSDGGTKSTDIYSTNIEVTLKGLRSDFLSYSLAIQGKFKEALVADTILHGKIVNISEASSENPHQIANVLKGNKLFNDRLLGIHERDSLIASYVNEQLNLSDSSMDFEKRVIWNRALSEDIYLSVKRNDEVEKKLNGIPLNLGEEDPSDLSYEDQISYLKTQIAQDMVRIAGLKQEITRLMSKNAFLKHGYTQFTDLESKSTSGRQIVTNDSINEIKINEWLTSQESLSQKQEQLVRLTASSQVYLSKVTSDQLQDQSRNSELNIALALDTLVSKHILRLESESPELFNRVDQLLTNNALINTGLTEIEERDSLISNNVLDMRGLKRKSSEYNRLNANNRGFTEEMTNLVNANGKVNVKSKELAEGGMDSLALELSQRISRDIALKQDISELILENAQLKQSLADSRDGGDSATILIVQNERIINQRILELEANIEALENTTLAAEKRLYPGVYAEHVIENEQTINDRLKAMLLQDNDVNGGLQQLMSTPNSIHPMTIGVVAENAKLNDHLFRINSSEVSLDQNVARVLQADSTVTVDSLVAANTVLSDRIGQEYALASTIHTNIRQTGDSLMQESSLKYEGLEQEIAAIIADNALLKEEIASLISANAVLKQQLVTNRNDTLLINEINEHTHSISLKLDEWEQNIALLQRKRDDLEMRRSLESRISTLFEGHRSLNEMTRKLIKEDSALNQRMIVLSRGQSSTDSTMLELHREVVDFNAQLSNINDRDLIFNQSLIEWISVGSSTADADQHNTKSVSLLKDMKRELDENAVLTETMTQREEENSSETMSLLIQTALLKNEIAMLINQNAAFKLYLDTVSISAVDDIIVESIELINVSIEEKIGVWQQNLLALGADASELQFPSDVTLVKEDDVTDDMVIEGYAIQVLAMSRGKKPLVAFMEELKEKNIKVAFGRDGLDRYYFGQYMNKNQALEAMRAMRREGYEDAFVRAIVKYSSL